MSRSLVIIPTFDHGETLRPAIHSALHQTDRDVQVVVIGDGAPSSTTALMDEICEGEQRVTYRQFPKSQRTGEPYRHEVLQHADAEFIFYLSDDDMWMPDHVEVLAPALQHHDLAVSLSAALLGEDRLTVSTIDLSDQAGRAIEVGPSSRVSMTEMSHRLDAYHRLPFGWRTTPKGTYTDHYMYQQWLNEPWVRAITVPAWTQIHLPVSHFGQLSTDDRVRMQWSWWEKFQDPSWAATRQEILVRSLLRQGTAVEVHWDHHLQRIQADAGALQRQHDELCAAHQELTAAHAAAASTSASTMQVLEAQAVQFDGEVQRLTGELDHMRSSKTWRYGQRLARLSGYRRLRS